MMAEIFIDVKTPGNGKVYEFRLDDKMPVGQVREKIIGEIIELESGNISLNPEKTKLYDLDTRMVLNETDILKASGVRSGQKLLLL